MRLIEAVGKKTEALRVRDIAQVLGVSKQQVYKMAAKGEIPSFRVATAIRFDPREFAMWLEAKYPPQQVTLINSSVRSA